VRRLHALGELIAVSQVYENQAIGGELQANFLNTAALVQVERSSDTLRNRLREIEAELGRVRTDDKYAPRTIDLDLALLGSRVEDNPPLPDPEIEQMAHLVIPLAELAPEFIHPISGETLGAIADQTDRPELFIPRPDVDEAIQATLEELEASI
jgi:2-amino-4-hydroxy-6-hydroxymethyldihydropteridine diphosphokinase